MRFILFLLTGIIPGFALSQQVCRVNLLQAHPYDTLQKYSYLVVSLRRDDRHHKDYAPIAFGTGFFVRKKDRLFLISARHVFSNCDPYGDPSETRVDTPVAIKVWYRDARERAVYRLIPLSGDKMLAPCKPLIAVPDADTLDVTAWFKGEKINSVDSLMPDYRDFHFLSPCDTVVTYGYPIEPNNADSIEKNPNLRPVGYISYSSDMPNDQTKYVLGQLSASYYAIEPGLPKGVSGAPVFRVSWSENSGKPIVQFSGIQSGTKEDWKFSYIVQGKVLADPIK